MKWWKKLYKPRVTIEYVRCSTAHRVSCEKRVYGV